MIPLKRRKAYDAIFVWLSGLVLFFSLLTLFSLMMSLLIQGVPRLNVAFFVSFPSRFAEQAGILSAWVGTLTVMSVTAVVAVPVGILAGLYLEEYASKNFLTSIIEINISNLAGVPSIVYGLMALGIFVYQMHLGQSILTAGLTLGLLVLPIIIVTTREALRTIPTTMREAAYALGATRWQVMRDHTIPYSMGGILTGVIIALSRAIGETAPLITIGALTFIAFLPSSIMDPFTVLPIQMFNWVSRPQEEFHQNAAAAGIVLIGLTLTMNALAIYMRYQFRKRIKW
ncbi:MAG: phosphate ABC transporter permease PstA [Deltaproteobacteria bacterium]|nr:phosphate ABC transporter permease PstA [Deltaproteobacteria bacterium]